MLNGQIEFVNRSDVGRKRPHNEDSTVSDPVLGLMMVADGMGGYKAGEVASAIAISVISDGVRHVTTQVQPDEMDENTGQLKIMTLIRETIVATNKLIYKTAKTDSQCQGMGTTVVMAYFLNNRIIVAHAGDSRAYRLRDDKFEQITSDHSLYQEMIDRGLYTVEEADKSVNKNLVTRALGIEESVNPDVQDFEAQPGDIYLLCSDGLSDMVKDEEIHLTLGRFSANLEQAADELVQLANNNGGKDNISVILARPLKRFSARQGWLSRFFK